MTDRTPIAFMFSLGLHGLVVAIMLLFAYSVNHQSKLAPKVFELVAGVGTNYGATVAPALGEPGGVKLALPPAPKATPAPPEAAPSPPAPAPEKAVTASPVKPAEPTAPNFARQITRRIIRGESKAKAEVAKERAEEAKRLARETADKAKVAAATPPKYSRIDAEGIKNGVVGGSTENKVGGAGGKALVREDGDALDLYFSLLRQNLQKAFDRPADVSDTLVATVQFYLGASGAISRVRIARSSGSAAFDRAVVEAFAHMSSLPPRPDGKSETVELDFKMREMDNG